MKSASTDANLKAVLLVPAHSPDLHLPRRRVPDGPQGRRTHDGQVPLNPATRRGADQPRKMVFQDPAGINFLRKLPSHVKLLKNGIYFGVSRRSDKTI